MKRSGLLYRMSSVVLILCLLFPVTLFGAQAPAPAAKKWPAAIRPGVMAGDKDNATDFNLDLLIPITGNEKNLLFFNPNLRIDDNSENEQNIGIGYRGLFSGEKLILGVNGFYDTMHSEHGNRYNQLGLGVEALSQWVDFRANYYSPINNEKHRLHKFDEYSFAKWSLIFRKGYEEALRGWDAEIGVLIPYISNVIETRAFLGGFWYDSDITDDLNGWRGRIEVRPASLLNLELEVRHDDYRGTNWFYGGYLDIPFSLDELAKGGSPFKGLKEAAQFGKGTRTLPERMTQKVVRDRHITTVADTSNNGHDKTIIVRDMIYVNQDNTGDQDGSLKHPWHDLETAQANDNRWRDSDGTQEGGGAWVYVFSWDAHPDTYIPTHAQLGDNMVLWGQGYYMNEPGRPWKLGGYKGCSGPEWNPILDGGKELLAGASLSSLDPAGDRLARLNFEQASCDNSVVCLANNNEIMGVTIQNGIEHGIFGYSDSEMYNDIDHPASYITTTNIHNNVIWDNGIFEVIKGNSGIHIENYIDSADLEGGDVLSYTFKNNTLDNNVGSGIFIRNEVFGETDIDGLTINNIFEKNKVSGSLRSGDPFGDGFGTGINVINEIYLDKEVGAASEDVALSINNVNINNTFTGNEIKANDDIEGSVGNEGTGIKVRNTIKGHLELGYTYNGNVDVSVDDGAAVSSTITDTHIINTFTDNIIDDAGIESSDGYHDGILAENKIEAKVELSDVIYGSGSTASSVSGSSIENELSGNAVTFTEYEGDGIAISNEIRSRNELEGTDEINDGDAASVTSSIEDSYISNDLSDNHVIYVGDLRGTGIGIDNEIKASVNMWNNSDSIDDNYDQSTVTVSATVAGSYIDNWLHGVDAATGNTVVFGDDLPFNQNGSGIVIENAILADVEMNDIDNTYNDAIIDVDAEVTGSTIENELTNNSVTFGDNYGYDGISIYNRIDADLDVDEIEDAEDNSVVNVGTRVADSGITNTLTGNTVTLGSGSGSMTALYVENEITAHVDITSDGINYIDDFATVNVDAAVNSSTIYNDLQQNTVTVSDTNNDLYGIGLDNEISATIEVEDDIYDLNEDGGSEATVNLTATVGTSEAEAPVDDALAAVAATPVASSITNLLVGNTVGGVMVAETEVGGVNNNGIWIDNDVRAKVEMDYADIEYLYDDARVNSTATVRDAFISNELTDNSINYTDYRDSGYAGIWLDNAIKAYVDGDGSDIEDMYDNSEVNDTALVSGAHITNTLLNNTVNNTDQYGIYIENRLGAEVELDDIQYEIDDSSKVRLSATTENSYIENSLTMDSGDPTVTFLNNNYDGSGIYIYNDIYADINMDRIYDVNGDAMISLTAAVNNVQINNTLTGNDINFGTDGDGVGILLENYIQSKVEVDYIEAILSSDLPSMDATVALSTINNELTNNTVDFGAGSEGLGIRINNYITAKSDLESYAEDGDAFQKATVNNSGITNTLTDNTLNGVEGTYDGIEINNYIEVEFDEWNYTDPLGLLSMVSIDNELTGNTVKGFDDGVEMYNEISVDYGAIEHASILSTFDTNIIQNNGAEGIDIYSTIVNEDGGPVTSSTDSYVLTGNDISNNGGTGFYLYSASDDNVIVSVSMFNNQVNGNDGDGVYLYDENDSSWVIDAGRTGSTTTGLNSFSDNLGTDFNNDTDKPGWAQYNYWNGTPDWTGTLIVYPYYTDALFTNLQY